ncbi:MAG: tetratricopeptide repeat protein [Candidatus Aminicenantales bacterium]
MVKKLAGACVAAAWLWSCATFEPHAPSFFMEDLPQSLIMEMSLEQRIAAEEAWKDLRTGNPRARKEIMQLGPDNPVYDVGLGYLYFQEQDLPSAERSFQDALKLRPELIAAHVGLAQVSETSGNEEQAFNHYREILKQQPEHAWAKPRYEALRDRKTDELLAQAKEAFAAGDAEAGKRAYLQALHYSPDSSAAHLSLARIYKGEKNIPNAILHFKAAESGDPTNAEVLKEYAETLYEAGEFGRSLDLYERLAEVDSKNADARDRIENLKNRLGIYELPSLYNSIADSEAVTREDLAALIAVKLKENLDDSGVKPPILVDIQTSWAARFILKVTALGIMEDFENHTFLPRKIINRAELAETMLRLVNHLKNAGARFTRQMQPERIQITDVPPDNFYYAPITQIVAYQIMDLSPQRSFRPDAAVGGQEAIRTLDIIVALLK